MTMTREEAIKILADLTDNLFLHTWEEQYKALHMAIEALSAEADWIPCSERLPEEGERVLATHLGGVNPNRQVIEHIYQCGEFTCGWDMDMNVGSPTFSQRYMGKVIAWMPLPKPYREESEVEE